MRLGADAGLRRETVSWQRERNRSGEVEDHGRGDPSVPWPAVPRHLVSGSKSVRMDVRREGGCCVSGTGGVCVWRGCEVVR